MFPNRAVRPVQVPQAVPAIATRIGMVERGAPVPTIGHEDHVASRQNRKDSVNYIDMDCIEEQIVRLDYGDDDGIRIKGAAKRSAQRKEADRNSKRRKIASHRSSIKVESAARTTRSSFVPQTRARRRRAEDIETSEYVSLGLRHVHRQILTSSRSLVKAMNLSDRRQRLDSCHRFAASRSCARLRLEQFERPVPEFWAHQRS